MSMLLQLRELDHDEIQFVSGGESGNNASRGYDGPNGSAMKCDFDNKAIGGVTFDPNSAPGAPGYVSTHCECPAGTAMTESVNEDGSHTMSCSAAVSSLGQPDEGENSAMSGVAESAVGGETGAGTNSEGSSSGMDAGSGNDSGSSQGGGGYGGDGGDGGGGSGGDGGGGGGDGGGN